MRPLIIRPFAGGTGRRFCCALLAVLLGWAVAPAQERRLIEFRIEDQFGREYRRDAFAGRASVWIGSDREGSAFNNQWGAALYGALKDEADAGRVRFVGVADLRGVPFFLKGFVRGKFPQDEKRRILMDWKGVFAEGYALKEKHSNILVFSPSGALVYRAAGREPAAAAVESTAAAVRGSLGRE